MEHSYYQKEHSYISKMEYSSSSSKWNTHIIKKELIQMEHSYYQNRILIKNGTRLLQTN